MKKIVTLFVVLTTALSMSAKDASKIIPEDVFATIEIANLTKSELQVGDQTYLQLMGRDDNADADVSLWLEGYTGEDKAYNVFAANSKMTFGGTDLTIISGEITQATDPEKGTVYDGYVAFTAEEDGEEYELTVGLKMYPAPAVEIEEEAVVTYDAATSTLLLSAVWEAIDIALEITNFEKMDYKEYEDVLFVVGTEEDELNEASWVDEALGAAAVIIEGDNVMVEGEFASDGTGKSYNVILTGTLPSNLPSALDHVTMPENPVKVIVNGQLLIKKNGVAYTAQGQVK